MNIRYIYFYFKKNYTLNLTNLQQNKCMGLNPPLP